MVLEIKNRNNVSDMSNQKAWYYTTVDTEDEKVIRNNKSTIRFYPYNWFSVG